MAQPKGWTPTLRYSPVNGVIVRWGFNGAPFCAGSLPQPNCEAPSPVAASVSADCSGDVPIAEPVDTYDWHRWVPEVIAGVENAPPDMAAAHTRRAAIEFATLSRVLQRQIAVKLQRGVYQYPLEPFANERIVGVQAISTPHGPCQCEGSSAGANLGTVQVNQARQELVIAPSPTSVGCHVGSRAPEWLLVTVWARPTEDSCEHDIFLYERYREAITTGARVILFNEFHGYGSYKTTRGYASARGDALTFKRAQEMRTEFLSAARKARVEACAGAAVHPAPAPVFSGGRGY